MPSIAMPEIWDIIEEAERAIDDGMARLALMRQQRASIDVKLAALSATKALPLPGTRTRRQNRQAAINKIEVQIKGKLAEGRRMEKAHAALRRQARELEKRMDDLENEIKEDRRMVMQLKARIR